MNLWSTSAALPNLSLGTDTQQQNAAARRMLRAGQLGRWAS